METPCGKSSRINVIVRARPVLGGVDKPPDDSEVAEMVVDINEPEGAVVVALDKTFAFDAVFDGDSGQASLYGRAVQELVGKFVYDAVNVSIMAYGQTGAGKTHTMIGKLDPEGDDDRGVVPRAVEDVFAGVDSDTDDVTVSFFEILNEKVYDLLGPETRRKCPLPVRQEGLEFTVPGLTARPVSSVDEAVELLKIGVRGRSTGSTAQNESSSRSHAIFRLNLARRSFAEPGVVAEVKLNLVDLAGSESVKRTQAIGERLAEANGINRGLLALGNCVSDICMRKPHIPFRNSTLTKILKESLQGNGWTAMIACISPSETDLMETVNTLRYADRAKQMRKPPIPAHLLQEGQRKRRLANLIPSTPSHWKRGGFNRTIETPTPTKRYKPEPPVYRLNRTDLQTGLNTTPSVISSSLLDASALSPVFRKFTDRLEQRIFSRFEETIRTGLQSVRRSPRLRQKFSRTSITEMVEQSLRNEGLDDLIASKPLAEPNPFREQHVRDVEATASPSFRRSLDKENSNLEETLGVNLDSPGMDIFNSPTETRPAPRKRSVRRTTMMSDDLAKSLRESGRVCGDITNNRRRRSVRIAEKEDKRQSDFKQPLQVTKNWKITNQDGHNASMLKLLNTANISMLQSIPAIGPKTAFIIHQHRELHDGFDSFEDLKAIPGLRKNFFDKFIKVHQITLE